MQDQHDFLVEIGTEELPPKALRALSEAFGEGVHAGLADAVLQHEGIALFATPRRLAVRVDGLRDRQPDRVVELRGPPQRIAFDDAGAPTRAALAFAQKCGVDVDALQTETTDKGSWLVHRGTETGQPAAALLPGIVATALEKLPIPKRMRWGSHETEFVRPVHWVLMLLDDEVLPAEILDIASGNLTYGHRFHAPDALTVTHPDDYAGVLAERGFVIADFSERRRQIDTAVSAAADAAGGKAVFDDALLDEVTALVEWPVAISAGFDARFLELPDEVLIETLQAHQRYFPVRGSDGLLPVFITISNIASKNPDEVRSGNERVVLPRLADAAFFWDTDRRTPLAERTEALDGVVFQKKLGTLGDKTQRVAALATGIATDTGADAALAGRAARLAKCDLLTEMVGEFPALQGTMGRYYATADGEPEAVALAIEEQYLPRHAGDALPQTDIGAVLSIADKTDTIAGIFAIGQRPTGTRDPFALRRSALGVLRLLIETQRELDLPALIAKAVGLQPVECEADKLEAEIYRYFVDRLRAWYLDDAATGISAQIFESVAARSPASPLDFHQRLMAVKTFADLDAASALAAANKRIANILRNAGEDTADAPDAARLREPAERALHEAVTRTGATAMPLLAQRDYAAALETLASLRPAVDRFFDEVLVMDDDRQLRANRLALLQQLRELFLHVADVSHLQVG